MARFERDPQFAGELARSVGVQVVLHDRAEAVAELARQLAPDDPRTTSGDLRASIEAEVGSTARGYVGRVNAFAYYAAWWEKGHSAAGGFRVQPFLVPALEAEVGPVHGDDALEGGD